MFKEYYSLFLTAQRICSAKYLLQVFYYILNLRCRFKDLIEMLVNQSLFVLQKVSIAFITLFIFKAISFYLETRKIYRGVILLEITKIRER